MVGGIGTSTPGDFQHNWKKLVIPVPTNQTAAKHLQEVKHDVIHIKVPRLSNVFDMVCFTSILSNSQFDDISLVDASINNAIMHNVERLIKGDNLLVSNKMSSDCIGQCNMKIRKAGGSNIFVFKLSPSLLPKVLSTWIACGHSGIKIRKPKVKSNLIADADVVITSKVSDPKTQAKL
jgi:hypothetical protein